MKRCLIGVSKVWKSNYQLFRTYRLLCSFSQSLRHIFTMIESHFEGPLCALTMCGDGFGHFLRLNIKQNLPTCFQSCFNFDNVIAKYVVTLTLSVFELSQRRARISQCMLTTELSLTRVFTAGKTSGCAGSPFQRSHSALESMGIEIEQTLITIRFCVSRSIQRNISALTQVCLTCISYFSRSEYLPFKNTLPLVGIKEDPCLEPLPNFELAYPVHNLKDFYRHLAARKLRESEKILLTLTIEKTSWITLAGRRKK